MRIRSVEARTALDTHHNAAYVTITTELGLVGLARPTPPVLISRLPKPYATSAGYRGAVLGGTRALRQLDDCSRGWGLRGWRRPGLSSSRPRFVLWSVSQWAPWIALVAWTLAVLALAVLALGVVFSRRPLA